jgi:hypothetical protein
MTLWAQESFKLELRVKSYDALKVEDINVIYTIKNKLHATFVSPRLIVYLAISAANQRPTTPGPTHRCVTWPGEKPGGQFLGLMWWVIDKPVFEFESGTFR